MATHIKRQDLAQQQCFVENPWDHLRDFTDARIGLGRAGVSVPTHHLLAFQLAHAQAQDAVHFPLDIDQLTNNLVTTGLLPSDEQPLVLQSQAVDRAMYLQRPDLGRRLDEASKALLNQQTRGRDDVYDLAIVIVDGLSSLAIQQNTQPFLAALDGLLTPPSLAKASLQEMSPKEPAEKKTALNIAPLTIVKQGRVAIGDEVGALLKAKTVLVLIGERPGLSSPDSLGLYMTWAPEVGLTDASRNCISNVRDAGLSHEDAANKLMYLLHESRRLKLSGVQLKERSEEVRLEQSEGQTNFLIA